MGLFNFIQRRRQRESAIPSAEVESLTKKLQGDGKPIGEPIAQALPQPGPGQINLGGADLGTIFSMFGQAMKTGNIQVTQGESQVIDLRGTELADQIRSMMGQYGIDVDNQDPTQMPQLSAQDGQAIQAQMMQALENAGVDTSQLGDMSGSGGDSGAGD